MFTADRPEFERHVALLCAAYNVPVGDRGEAYWTAFNRLSLVEWARMVACAIGPDGSDKVPTTKQLWGIRKQLVKTAVVGRPGTNAVLSALVETAVAKWPLTEAQRRMPWNWIARDPEGQDCAILGVIIPQDPDDPDHYPAHRLMVADLEQVRA